MRKTVIYCRVSSDRQVREGHGLQGQEQRCRAYAQAHGYHPRRLSNGATLWLPAP